MKLPKISPNYERGVDLALKGMGVVALIARPLPMLAIGASLYTAYTVPYIVYNISRKFFQERPREVSDVSC